MKFALKFMLWFLIFVVLAIVVFIVVTKIQNVSLREILFGGVFNV